MRPSPLGGTHCTSNPRPLPDRNPMQSQTSRWTAQELVVLGVFAAAAKISSLLIALAGGGMNPVMLILKNLVFTTLLVVLLTKVPKSGTLLLFTAVTMLVSLLLLGGSIALIPAAFIGAAAGEIAGKLAAVSGGCAASLRRLRPTTSFRKASRSAWRTSFCARARASCRS